MNNLLICTFFLFQLISFNFNENFIDFKKSFRIIKLNEIEERDDDSCRYCGSLVENTEHALFVCARWGVSRKAVGRAVGVQLTPDTMVSIMLQSEQIWMLIE